MNGSNKPSILVLADLFFASKLKGEVQACGYEYSAAAGPKSALAKARENLPAAIVLDIGKQRLDYVGFIESVRSDPATASVPIIAFCGHMDVGKMEEAKAAGATLAVSNGQISAEFPAVLRLALDSAGAPRG